MSLRYFGQRFSLFQQTLVVILVLIVAVIILGTAAAFWLKKTESITGIRKSDPTPEQLVKNSPEKTTVYTGIGQLRAVTSDNPPVSLVITPYFSYSQLDNALYEEIVQKKRKIRALILGYVTQHTKRELQNLGELEVKKELLQLINVELVMGKIPQLYFTEYIFL